MLEKQDKDGSPIPDPDGEIFRSRTRSFSTNKIAEEAQREQEMRPRCSSFASPFRHAFRNYLDRMVEEEHKKQCIIEKPPEQQQQQQQYPPQMRDRPPSHHPAEHAMPTIHESPEQYREKALKRKAEMERMDREAKMAKLEKRLAPPPGLQEESTGQQRNTYTTRSIMEAMVETAVNNYHETVDNHPKPDPFRQYPLQKFSNLTRSSPTEEGTKSPNVEAVTKDAFSNHSILSAAELAHRIIESRVKHFSGGDESSPERKPPAQTSAQTSDQTSAQTSVPTSIPAAGTPQAGNSAARESSRANTAPVQPPKPVGAGSLKNFIEDLVTAEVNSYDTTEISNKPSILAQLGEDVAPIKKPSPPPPVRELPSAERPASSSPGLAPDVRDRTCSFSKFDKIRRHHSLKKPTDDPAPSTSINTSRSASPAKSDAVPPPQEKVDSTPPVRHISAVDVVHATISRAFMSCSPPPKPKEQETRSEGEERAEESKQVAPDTKREPPTKIMKEKKSALSDVSEAEEEQSVCDARDNAPDDVDKSAEVAPVRAVPTPPPVVVAAPLPPPPPPQVPIIDPPSPFSDCSENNLQIVLPEDDDEEDDTHSDDDERTTKACMDTKGSSSLPGAADPSASEYESSTNE